jgi:hypothetical protein
LCRAADGGSEDPALHRRPAGALSIDVQLQGPQSLEVVMSFARSYEWRK